MSTLYLRVLPRQKLIKCCFKAASYPFRNLSRREEGVDGEEPVKFSTSKAAVWSAREENDIDLELNKTLYDRIPGLERKQLEIVLEYNEGQGLDTTDIRNRIDELDEAGKPQ